jgi:mannose/cellobiose epimerase-like protein (N-acyl-D-glucosamine 2-epimerase family)
MSTVKGLSIQLPIVGRIKSRTDPSGEFTVETRSGARFRVHVKATTWVDTVTNLDRLGRRRQPLQTGSAAWQLETAVQVKDRPDFLAYSQEEDLIAVEGTLYLDEGFEHYEAMAVHLLTSHKRLYLFEHTHWWKTQIEAMANKWLDVLFGDKRTYALDDFSALYHTTLNIEGMPTDDRTQEMATLSRLIYGLSSAYLLGGDERYYLAAEAGVQYQREAFRSYSTDGRFCFWLHARKRDRHGIYDSLASANPEDSGTIPLYEQIYALAGLAQFYRITNDRETLEDIKHTLSTFDALFADRRQDNGRTWHDGYFSHIDPVTFSWDSPELERVGPGGVNNRARKNWNSIGDHLPAYLINLILSLDPLPAVADDADGEHTKMLQGLLDNAVHILEVTADLIDKHFPEKGNAYVNERFTRDWHAVKDWGWQQDRAVVGHNLKIAWNLTRVANYYRSKGECKKADQMYQRARTIGECMKASGIDGIRSGVFDAVERVPSHGVPVQFAWRNTKDFWQQEQGILAYLILFGCVTDPSQQEAVETLAAARELSAVWNLYFLDRERIGIFFRVSDNGYPVIESTYGDKGGHSISGYHAFELAYLAHVYQLAYLPRAQQQHTTFCMHFRPSRSSNLRSINVLPDYLGPDALELCAVEVDGVPKRLVDEEKQTFRVLLREQDLGRHVKVYLRQSKAAYERLSPHSIPDETLP